MFKKKRNIGKLLLGSFLIVAVLTALFGKEYCKN